MVDVIVEHDYLAQDLDELTIKKGDIIKDATLVEEGWYKGVLNDKKGLFPENFVKIMKEPSKNTVVLRKKEDVVRIRQCRVVFSYEQDHEDELNLKVGDVIDIIGEEEEGWWRGTLNGKEGVFPSNFVEEVTQDKSRAGSREDLTLAVESDKKTDTDVPVLPAKPVKQMCKVKFTYTAQNEDELSLKENDIVTILSKEGQDPGWWKGELNGKIGVFPDNFVVIIPEEKSNLKDENHPKSPVAVKPSSIVTQRKSLEVKSPPVPSKKPAINIIKKSPSGSGLFSEIKKKLVDVVDGATSSKSSSTKTEPIVETPKDNNNDNAFDQVERRPILVDVRATRAKAPGRRPPTTVFKDEDLDAAGIPNGNVDHPPEAELRKKTTSQTSEVDTAEVKPRVREWEKHQAPWLSEMKQHQAKRTSTSPGPETKLKITPTERAPLDKETKVLPSSDKESPESQMSKSLNALGILRAKTPPNELDKDVVPKKPTVPIQQNRQNLNLNNNIGWKEAKDSKESKPVPTKKVTSPVTAVKTPPTPTHKPLVSDRNSMETSEPIVSYKQFSDMLERVSKLEALVEKQNRKHSQQIDDLKSKLQVETDMRIMLQAEVDKLSMDNLQV